MADVDTKVFQAHSLRGASTSKVLLHGLSVKEVVTHGKWSLVSTWQKFYRKPVSRPNKEVPGQCLEALKEGLGPGLSAFIQYGSEIMRIIILGEVLYDIELEIL